MNSKVKHEIQHEQGGGQFTLLAMLIVINRGAISLIFSLAHFLSP